METASSQLFTRCFDLAFGATYHAKGCFFIARDRDLLMLYLEIIFRKSSATVALAAFFWLWCQFLVIIRNFSSFWAVNMILFFSFFFCCGRSFEFPQ